MAKTKTYLHRVAVSVTTEYLLDVEAENAVGDITDATITAFKEGKGEPEVRMTMINGVTIFPWLEDGQEPPKGSEYPNPTEVDVEEVTYFMGLPL
jgi:hypothetical protein